MAWGYHLTVDAYDCDPKSIRDQFNIQRFVEALVPRIGMKAFGGPLIIKFGSGPTAGYTLCQLIETSNITAHFADETNSIYFDLFSCKQFDQKAVEDVLRQFFRPGEIVSNLNERGNRPVAAAPAPAPEPVVVVEEAVLPLEDTNTTKTFKKKT